MMQLPPYQAAILTSHRTFIMTKRTKIIAGALGLACLALTGCVSEEGGYYGGGAYYGRSYSGYNPVYDRDRDGRDRYWRYRRNRDRDHHGSWHGDRDDRGNRGQTSRNQAAYDRDKPNPTWAGSGPRGRDNDRDRGWGSRSGGRDILIPAQ
jgi:hypothetical protein